MNIQDARDLSLQIRRLEEQIAALRRLAERVIPHDMLKQALADQSFERHFPVETIYHITPLLYYASRPSGEPYLPESYAQDGFIHCTRGADLMIFVANRHYRHVPGDFAMLVIDVRALTSPLKYEALDNSMIIAFPHIYEPINRDAIVEVHRMKRSPDGTFLAPPYAPVPADIPTPTVPQTPLPPASPTSSAPAAP